MNQEQINDKSFIAKTWAQRAQAELGADVRFLKLLKEFARLEMSVPILKLVFAASQEEKRHAKMCSAIAMHFGHQSGFETPDLTDQPQYKSWNIEKFDERDQLLCEVVCMCCITETINASLLNTLAENMNLQSKVGRVMKSILEDELRHGQIGWLFLREESQKRDVGFLSEVIAEMLEISVRDELFLPALSTDERSNDVLSVDAGVLPSSFRLEQFENTLTSLVLPGFEHLGIKTDSANHWVKNKLK